ncbi:Two pore potassium channel c [Acorus calamus]|uniref:Two pore potassium channel c n=1 Tax=Acorus calamus TaxID=4465 RepID=A0AAV9FKR1_ACOCL|nr:Two pore potassium channel c [Acorus calamus]
MDAEGRTIRVVSLVADKRLSSPTELTVSHGGESYRIGVEAPPQATGHHDQVGTSKGTAGPVMEDDRERTVRCGKALVAGEAPAWAPVRVERKARSDGGLPKTVDNPSGTGQVITTVMVGRSVQSCPVLRQGDTFGEALQDARESGSGEISSLLRLADGLKSHDVRDEVLTERTAEVAYIGGDSHPGLGGGLMGLLSTTKAQYSGDYISGWDPEPEWTWAWWGRDPVTGTHLFRRALHGHANSPLEVGSKIWSEVGGSTSSSPPRVVEVAADGPDVEDTMSHVRATADGFDGVAANMQLAGVGRAEELGINAHVSSVRERFGTVIAVSFGSAGVFPLEVGQRPSSTPVVDISLPQGPLGVVRETTCGLNAWAILEHKGDARPPKSTCIGGHGEGARNSNLKSEYVIYKLKEMGKIAEKDILQICEQFDSTSSQEKKLYQSSSKYQPDSQRSIP